MPNAPTRLELGGQILDRDVIAPLEATTASDPELSAIFARTGVMVVRNVLREATVNRLCQRFDALVATNSAPTAYGTRGHPAFEIQNSIEFRDVCDAPSLNMTAAVIMGLPMKRLARIPFRSFGFNDRATHAHADWDYLDRGTRQIVTAWIPLTPITIRSGPLIYLAGSSAIDRVALRDAVREHHPTEKRAVISRDLGQLATLTGRRWLYSEMSAGDVIFHCPDMIHASLPCAAGERRVSVDVRFIPEGQQADPRWEQRWSADDGY